MYKKVLVPLDGSDLAECVLPHVKTIAGGCGTEAVIFLRVVEPVVLPSGYFGPDFSGEELSASTRSTRQPLRNISKSSSHVPSTMA